MIEIFLNKDSCIDTLRKNSVMYNLQNVKKTNSWKYK